MSLTAPQNKYVNKETIFALQHIVRREKSTTNNNIFIILYKILFAGNITRDVALSSTTPGQTAGLISKVQDVAETYLQTLQAASSAIGRDMNDPSMNVLMKRATSLAGVLTTLMRSLRVFN